MKPLHDDAWRYIEYLNFKMQCAADQEELRWKVDVPKAKALLEELEDVKRLICNGGDELDLDALVDVLHGMGVRG